MFDISNLSMPVAGNIMITREGDMDTTAVILKVIEVIPRFLPHAKPPAVDYSRLIAAYNPPQITLNQASESVIPAAVETIPAPVIMPGNVSTEKGNVREVGTACMACSRSHLSTVSGALNEALRFARDEGMSSPEVQKRILMGEDEINIMERIDLSAESLQTSPPEEADAARQYLPKIRKLRQRIGQIDSVDKLEQAASDASVLSQEFRLHLLQMKGVDLNPVVELAKKVRAGEITMEEARARIKGMLPEEE
jgi:hypothetical protein